MIWGRFMRCASRLIAVNERRDTWLAGSFRPRRGAGLASPGCGEYLFGHAGTGPTGKAR